MLPAPEIPFLNSNLFDFTKNSLERHAPLLVIERVEIFTPESWEMENPYTGSYLDYLGEEHEYVLLFSLSQILAGTLEKDDLAFLQERPDRIFFNNNIMGGFLNKDSDISTPPPEQARGLFSGFYTVSLENFREINTALLENLRSSGYPQDLKDVTVIGSPIILSDSISNSTICGPSFIGEGVVLSDVYVGPGSVIVDSSVHKSRVYSSFVASSTIGGVGRLENSLIGGASLSGISALDDSVVPKGAFIQAAGRGS